jgi:hypothetical protein
MHILPETGRLVLDDSTIVQEFISSHDDIRWTVMLWK